MALSLHVNDSEIYQPEFYPESTPEEPTPQLDVSTSMSNRYVKLNIQSHTLIDFHKLPNPTHPLVFSISANVNYILSISWIKNPEIILQPSPSLSVSLPNHSMTISCV